MKLLGLLLPITLWAGIPSNSIVMTEARGVPQTNRPVQIHRVFALGEIPHFAMPVIPLFGTPAIWQNDVKQRWRDGSSVCPITNVSATTPIFYTAHNCGYQEGESVTITGVVGVAGANVTGLTRKAGANGFYLMNTAGTGSYMTGGSASGPGPGSLRDVIITYPFSVSASTAYTVNFVDSVNQCSSGNSAACVAAALTPSGMLAFNGGTWDATIQTLADDGGSGIGHSASARTMLGNATIQSNLIYWLQGPAVTQVVARDNTKTFSWGYHCTGSFVTNDCNAAWSDDVTNLSLSPTYILTFYTNWAGVRVFYVLENDWTDSLQDQRYKLTLSNSSGVVESPFNLASGFGMPHFARSRWVREYWDGNEPGGATHYKDSVRMDMNFSYMIYSKAIPAYLQTITPSTATINTFTSAYASNTQAGHETLVCINASNCGNVEMGMVAGGSRNSAIGLLNNYESLAMMAQSVDGLNLVEKNARMLSLIPIHVREASSRAISYDPAGDTAAQYKWISRISRPTVDIRGAVPGCQVAGDIITPVATLAGSSWQIDGGHYPSGNYAAYLLTGDYYYMDEQQAQGTFLTMNQNNAQDPFLSGKTPWLGSCGGFGESNSNGMRYVMWCARERLYADFVSPDGSGEKSYFRYAFLYLIEFFEGYENCTTCALYEAQTSPGVFVPSTDASIWAAGRWKAGNVPMDLKLSFGGGSNDGWGNSLDVNKAPVIIGPMTDLWMHSFEPDTVGMGGQLGLPVADFAADLMPLYTKGVLASQGSPSEMMVSEYVTPIINYADAPRLTSGIISTDLTIPVDHVTTLTYPQVAVFYTTQNIIAANQSPMGFTVGGSLSGLGLDVGVRLSGVGGMNYANCGWWARNVVGGTQFDIVLKIRNVTGSGPVTIDTTGSCLHAGQTVTISNMSTCTNLNGTWTLGTVSGTTAVVLGTSACSPAYVDVSATSAGVVAPYGDNPWTSGGVATAFSGPEYVVLSGDNGSNAYSVMPSGRGFVGGNNAQSHSANAPLFLRTPYSSWTDILNGYNATEKAELLANSTAVVGCEQSLTGWGTAGECYQAIGAMSFGTAATNGQAAYDVYNNARSTSALAAAFMPTNPKWAIQPYRDPVKNVSVTSILTTSVIINYTKPRADVACTVGGVSDGVTNSRTVAFSLSGLTPGTGYSKTIHCADDPYTNGDTSVSFNTLSAASSTIQGTVKFFGKGIAH